MTIMMRRYLLLGPMMIGILIIEVMRAVITPP